MMLCCVGECGYVCASALTRGACEYGHTHTGFGQTHVREQAHLVNQALDLNFGGLHTL